MPAHQPLLLIGIGSSGLYTLENVQNFYYENTGSNKPPHVEYLYIETNKDNRPGITAVKNQIKRVYISLADMKVMIQELKKEYKDDMPWLPPEEQVLEAGMGAGGIPAAGRLALWGRNKEGSNINNVMQAIRGMHSRVSGMGAQGSDASRMPAVFITGSLTGGTGSGIFLDMAYLVRHAITGIQDVYSLLLLPPDTNVIQMSGNEIIYANAFGALKAIEHYNKEENKYVLPDNNFRDFIEPPYELNQFICQSYNDGRLPSLNSLSGLYKMAGLYLFLNMIGLRAKRRERLVDAAGNNQIGKYGTFGLSGIQYPKAQIQEYLSLDLGIRLLKRWIDPQYYYQADSRLKIDEFKISREINDNFSSFLEGAFQNMNASGGYNINEEIKKEVEAIKNGDKEDPRRHLYQLFSPDQGDSFYNFINNRLSNGVDNLVRSFNEYIIETFNKYESLFYTRRQLLGLSKAIKETLDYWKSIGIARKSTEWEASLSSQVGWMLDGNYDWLFEGKNVLNDRMHTVLEKLKMHLFFEKLIELGKNIERGETPFETSSFAEKISLPTLKVIDNLVYEIQVTIGEKDDETDVSNLKSLQKRKNEIEGDMADTTIPIKRIFPSGSFEKEWNISKEKYKQVTGKNFPTKDSIIPDSDLWNYLNKGSNTPLRQRLYNDCILKFREELDRNNVIEDYNVADFVKKNIRESVIFAEKSISYLLPIRKKILERSSNIPKMVIGADKDVIKEVIDALRAENFLEFEADGDNMLEIPELKNLMVFYIEQGNFNPLQDIDYIPEVKKVDVEYPQKKSISEKKWYTFRNPYLNNGKSIK